MVDKRTIILLSLFILIIAIPIATYNDIREKNGIFSGSDDAAGKAIEKTGYKPWFSPIWEPPSDEIESLLFTLQAVIGAVIIGFVFGYFLGQKNKDVKTDGKKNL